MEIDVNAGGWVYPRLGFGLYNEEVLILLA